MITYPDRAKNDAATLYDPTTGKISLSDVMQGTIFRHGLQHEDGIHILEALFLETLHANDLMRRERLYAFMCMQEDSFPNEYDPVKTRPVLRVKQGSTSPVNASSNGVQLGAIELHPLRCSIRHSGGSTYFENDASKWSQVVRPTGITLMMLTVLRGREADQSERTLSQV